MSWCQYPDPEDGSRCGQVTKWRVQRMPTDWTGEHKYVEVCDKHAALWREAIPYCYMESLATGEPYPGQVCTTPYEKSYLPSLTLPLYTP